MLKHFAAATLGFAVLLSAAGPAAADKAGRVWANKSFYVYTYPATPYTYPYTGTVRSKDKSKFNPRLDFETEAVWRNLRPEWFD
jgi:hypothetical protein